MERSVPDLAADTGPLSADENPYAEWINEYSSIAYQEIAAATVQNLDTLASEMMTEARYPRLKRLFAAASRLEADFWQMGLNAASK